MLRIAILLLAAAVPVLAQTPPPKSSSQDLGFPDFDAFLQYLQRLTPQQRESVLAKAQLPLCYFIQQVNRNLQKPKDKPEFVPLASAGSAPAGTASSSCLSGTIIRKAFVPGN